MPAMNDIPTVENIIKYLKTIIKLRQGPNDQEKLPMGWKYNGFEGFLLKYGKEFKEQKLPKDIKRGPLKQCFKNASELALFHQKYELTYCEGIAFGAGLIPVHHAWCIDKNQKVVDPTWTYKEQKIYFGVPFKRDYLLNHLLNEKVYGIFYTPVINLKLMTGEHGPDMFLEDLNHAS